MATIKAMWRRTVRLKEYESETLELEVERGWDEVNDGDAVRAAVELNRELAEVGDALITERLEERMKPPAEFVREERVVKKHGARLDAPDDYVA